MNEVENEFGELHNIPLQGIIEGLLVYLRIIIPHFNTKELIEFIVNREKELEGEDDE